jgi:hypothetical protein
MVSKLDLIAVAVALSAGALWIERQHHRLVVAPITAEPSALATQASSAPGVRPRPRVTKAEDLERNQADADSNGAECPDKDDGPYTERCIAFMSGLFWRPDASDRAADTSALRPRSR